MGPIHTTSNEDIRVRKKYDKVKKHFCYLNNRKLQFKVMHKLKSVIKTG